jgi:hypothetical protein
LGFLLTVNLHVIATEEKWYGVGIFPRRRFTWVEARHMLRQKTPLLFSSYLSSFFLLFASM